MTPSPCAAGDATRRIVRPETRRDETRGKEEERGTPRRGRVDLPVAAFLSDSVPLVASSTCTCQHGLPRTTHYQFVLTRPQRLHHETRDVFVPFVALGAQHREENEADYKNGACGRSSSTRSVAFVQHTRLLQCGTSNANAAHRPLRSGPALTTNLPRRRSLKPFATFSARFAHNALALWNDRIGKRQS